MGRLRALAAISALLVAGSANATVLTGNVPVDGDAASGSTDNLLTSTVADTNVVPEPGIPLLAFAGLAFLQARRRR
jgi:hypothetical protein